MLVPLANDVPQVLLALYPHSILPFIEERIRQGRRDPRSLLEIAPVQYISEEQLRQVDPHLRSFINVNTPGELEELR
jgi:molybdopterin-guanine dinucleotide biosynthesis protein A